MNATLAGPRRGGSAVAVVLALLLVLLVPATAQAAEVAGGSTPGAAVPIPLADLEGSFTASNAHVTSTGTSSTSVQPYWNNVAWYSWTPAETVDVFIRATSVSPQGWDNALEIWTAGGAFVAQNDDFYGLDSALVVTLEAGTGYHIGLGGFASHSKGSADLQLATRAPGPPQDVSAVFGDRSAQVTWNAPADVAGGVTAYDVLCTPAGGAETVCARLTGTPPSTSTTVSGLTNGVSYSVRVRAENVIGAGEPSAAAVGVPQAASAVSVTTDPAAPVSGGSFDVVVSVTSSGSPVSGGTVDVTVGGVVVEDVPVTDGAAVAQGLTRTAGDHVVSAQFSGTATIAPASGGTTVTVARRSQTVSFPAVPEGLVFGDDVELTATASSGLPVGYGTTGPCTLEAALLTMTGVGTCQVTASQAGDSETLPADASQSVEIGKRSQTIDHDELSAMVYGQEPVTVSAASSVGLPVELTATGACALVDGLLTTVAVGECTVTATQAGDEVTHAAQAVVRTAVVAKRTQTISMPTLPSVVFGVEPRPVTATSDLGLPVTLTGAGACRVSEGVLTIVGIGECTLTAVAEGDDVTEPATVVLTADVLGIASSVSADLHAPLGALAAGAAVSASGLGLLPDSTLELSVRGSVQVLGSATVLPDGTATVDGSLPELPAGSYELLAAGTALDGSPAESALGFRVGADGTLVAAANPTLAVTGADAGPLMATAALWVLLGAALLVTRRRLAAA